MSDPNVLPYETSPQVGGLTVRRDASRTVITLRRRGWGVNWPTLAIGASTLWCVLPIYSVYRNHAVSHVWICLIGVAVIGLPALIGWAAIRMLVRPIVWTVTPLEAVCVVHRGLRIVRQRYESKVLTEIRVDRVRLPGSLTRSLSLVAKLPTGQDLVLLQARKDEMKCAESAMQVALGLRDDPLGRHGYPPLAGRVQRVPISSGVLLAVSPRGPAMLAAIGAVIAWAGLTYGSLAFLIEKPLHRYDWFDLLIAAISVLFSGIFCAGLAWSALLPLWPVERVHMYSGYLSIQRNGLSAFEEEWPRVEVLVTREPACGIRFTPAVGEPIVMFATRSAAESDCVFASLAFAAARLDPSVN